MEPFFESNSTLVDISSESTRFNANYTLPNITLTTDDIFYHEMANPEEMKNPAQANPYFLHILITHIITFVLGILGNLFVVVVMVGDRKNRSATTLFLISLALSDILLLLFCVPLETLQYFMVQWNDDGTVCKLTRYVELLSAAANVLTLCAVSVERFVVIVFPMRSRSICTMTNCRRAILLVWIMALVISTPVIPAKSGFSVVYRNSSRGVSVKIFYCEDEKSNLPLAIYKLVVLFVAPAILMLVCYLYVIWELWKSTRNISNLTNSNSFREASRPGGVVEFSCKVNGGTTISALTETTDSNLLTSSRVTTNGNELEVPMSSIPDPHSRSPTPDIRSESPGPAPRPGSPTPAPRLGSAVLSSRQKLLNQSRVNRAEDAKKVRKQVIRMLILIILLFLICWGPKLFFPIGLEIANFYNIFYFTQELYVIRVIFHLIPFVHSCINPIIYSAMSKNFRRSARRQMHRFCAFFGCTTCCKAERKQQQSRSSIPMRPTRTRSAMHGVDSNYCRISQASSTTRQTGLERVTAM